MKSRRPGASKLSQSSKPVMPAIPLPHVKRQAASAAARASAVPVSSTAASTTTQELDARSLTEVKLTNGNIPAEVKKDDSVATAASSIASPTSTSTSKVDKEAAETKADTHKETKNDASGPTNTQAPSAASVPEHPTTTKDNENTHKNAMVSDHSDQPTPKNHADIEAQSVHKVAVEANKPNGVSSRTEVKPQSDNHPPSKLNKTRTPSVVPPGRYQMPPSFQPGARAMGPNVNGDMRGPRAPLPNGPPMHQPHHSNGSIHFGAFHGSASSSPAPLSGGIAPPPGMPVPDGRPPYMAPANGYPPMMPYGADQVPVTTFDNYGRPTMAYGPPDSFAPFPNNFGPPTPHSYHDSQASGPPDDGSVYNQFSSVPVRNGVPGPEESQSPNQPGRMFGGPEYPQMMPNAGPPPHMMSGMDDADGLIGHLQQRFGSSEFADCVLELRYTDERAAPVRIPGHRLLFSRSAELANAISKQLSRPNTNVPSLPTIVLETKSKWIRTQTFVMAAQRLYGAPLFSPLPETLKQAAADFKQQLDLFEYALSYAAAGHLLCWDPVSRRGCEVAMQLLNWQTVEKALEFALEDHRDEGSYDMFKYGDGSRIILNEIVSFIASNIHPTFKIDTSVTDPSNYARLPQTALTSNTTTRKLSPPPIARGTSVHLGKGKARLSQQISGIQFGDLSLTDGKVSPASDVSGASQPRTSFNAVLSRILLNLPFDTLKALLETATNKGSQWPNAEAIYRVVKDTVAERERRRLQIVELVKTRQITAWAVITQQLSSPEPKYVGLWSALGWREEILPFGPSESPALGRTWVPFTGPQTNAQAAYP
ncbi:topoisomerase ii-associated [Fusarium beomiforme]|uniref:Topoisomerase ii-associated n=1 Tax=Fusarium beomiforme TaxID=44412 RepID=A0A9P5E673_9HYPO|nr:topoisomerase ii-associated [Fusarium beomiforme]